MNIGKIGKLCERSGFLYIMDNREKGEQWISDGKAAYFVDADIEITEENAVPLFDFNKEEKKRPIIRRGEAAATNIYSSQRVERNGYKFGSIREADYYDELCVLRAAGEVRVIMRQVPFDLPGGIKYYADFCTVDKEGKFHVIDAKGVKTRVYINKKKQMKAIWGIDIEEV